MKKLRAQTIIPQDLYVERAADRQVRQIIDDMGRPGYVLVARQMGKTNLLLNARRCLSNPQTFFVYVDLSEKFETAADYYKLLLRTLGTTGQDLFRITNDELNAIDTDYVDHLYFERFIYRIFRRYAGKIIFILDEVDALANYEFGARIFSHIRSLYFAGRANYDEFDRLSYLLSGVAEPADLIKDKNISPFNIGEKIYLSDFSFEEFRTFIRKAALNLPTEVVAWTYKWCSGNPRMTWDIFSEIENICLTSKLPTTADVDSIVGRLYLDRFDHAPVDHVRQLAQNDREIREAILSLRQNRSQDITAKLRSKLYLAGITGAPESGMEIKIANRVIDCALSEQWITEVNKSVRGLLRLARENQEEHRYEVAIASYEEYLTDHQIKPESSDAYRLAICYFNTQRFTQSIDWFEGYLKSNDLQNDVKNSIYQSLAVAYLANSTPEKSIEYFRSIVEQGPNTAFYGSATCRLATLLLDLDTTSHFEEAKQLSLSAIDWLNANQVTIPAMADLFARARTNLGIIAEFEGDSTQALEMFSLALKDARGVIRSYILLRTGPYLTEDNYRYELFLRELEQSAIAALSDENREITLDLFSSVLVPTLVVLRLNADKELYDDVIRAASRRQVLKNTSATRLSLELWHHAYMSKLKGADVLLGDAIESALETPDDYKLGLDAARILYGFTDTAEYDDKYLTLFEKVEHFVPVEIADYYAFVAILYRRLVVEKVPLTDRILGLIEKLRSKSSPELTPNFAFVKRFLIIHYTRINQARRAREEAIELKELVISLRKANIVTPLLSDEVKQALIDTANTYLNQRSDYHVRKYDGAKIGRNQYVYVKYEDGRTSRVKFKNAQADLLAERCVLISLADN